MGLSVIFRFGGFRSGVLSLRQVFDDRLIRSHIRRRFWKRQGSSPVLGCVVVMVASIRSRFHWHSHFSL